MEKYLKVYVSETEYKIVYVYEDGRKQDVSENQDLYQAWLARGNEPEVVPYVIPVPRTQEEINAEICKRTVYKKLDIRRAMRDLGLEAVLDAFLQNETFKKDWDDATEIDLSDPMVIQALASASLDVNVIKLKIHEMSTTGI
jgi:hypothetical protein